MKPIIRYIDIELDDDEIKLTKEELEKIVSNAYDTGFSDGYSSASSKPNIVTPPTNPSPYSPQYPYPGIWCGGESISGSNQTNSNMRITTSNETDNKN